MDKLLLLLGLSLSFNNASSQVPCPVNCVCLTELGTTFCHLADLDLSGQRLTSIPTGSFAQAGNINTLSLANNAPLTLESDSFIGLTNITSLDLSVNMLTILPDGVFSPMMQLQSLNLRANLLSSLNPEAFRGLVNLQQLNLQGNRISVFPADDLLPLLPSLTTIQLGGNPYNCDDPRIVELYSTLNSPSIDVIDSMFVLCTNGTPVSDLQILLPTPTSSIIISVTPTSPFSSPASSAFPTTSQTRMDSPSSIATPSATPTPTPVVTIPNTCSQETTLTHSGYLVWPQTDPGITAMVLCPNGPSGHFAERTCLKTGVWLTNVDDQECAIGSPTEQLLADISNASVTEFNSELLSSQLASLPPTTTLSVQELDTVTSLANQLISAGGMDVVVLNNTLQALDNALQSSASSLTEQRGLEVASRIRVLVDSILLDALTINATELVLSFSHLAVGGAYLPATSSTHLLASIRILMNGGVVIDVGEGAEGDVIVDAEGNSTVQVTVYDGNDLFMETGCLNRTLPTTMTTTSNSNDTVNGEVVTPIISVTAEGVTEDNEEVTITYSHAPFGLTEGDRYVCARWNTSVNCGGGGWTTKDCSLAITSEGNYQCQCLHQGTFTLLDIPPELGTMPTLSEQLPRISRIIFYIMSTASIPLYLTIIVTILATRELRRLPQTQCLINQSLSQGLTFLILAISFERNEVLGVCFALGVVLQYLYLVSLSWLVAHPVLVAIRIFKRMLYEKQLLIFPFVAVCWGVPVIPVSVYGGLRYDTLTQNSTSFICWLESSLIPNTITYLTAVTVLGGALSVTIVLLWLSCSDYKLEPATYIRLVSNFPNLLLFSAVILSQYLTAAAPTSLGTNHYYILLAVGALALLCGCYFFLANAMLNSKIRNSIFCREDPVTRRKTAGYATNRLFRSSRPTPEESEGGSGESTPKYSRRVKTPGAHNLGHINYVGDYLGRRDLGGGQRSGAGVGLNPIPLSLFSQVQQSRQLGGRAARVVRRSGDMTGLGPNPAYTMDPSTSEV